MNTNMVRTTLNDELDAARAMNPTWYAEFDDSCLHIAGSADVQACARLAATAPTPTLRGYVWGLLVNN